MRNASSSGASEKPRSSTFVADGVTTRYCDTGRPRLAYRELGPDTQPPLLLTQQFRGTLDDWDPAFLDAVSEKRRVISSTASAWVSRLARRLFRFRPWRISSRTSSKR